MKKHKRKLIHKITSLLTNLILLGVTALNTALANGIDFEETPGLVKKVKIAEKGKDIILAFYEWQFAGTVVIISLLIIRLIISYKEGKDPVERAKKISVPVYKGRNNKFFSEKKLLAIALKIIKNDLRTLYKERIINHKEFSMRDIKKRIEYLSGENKDIILYLKTTKLSWENVYNNHHDSFKKFVV